MCQCCGCWLREKTSSIWGFLCANEHPANRRSTLHVLLEHLPHVEQVFRFGDETLSVAGDAVASKDQVLILRIQDVRC
jgi:hypothetical protein